MKTLKRTLVLLLVLAMSVSLFSVAAFAKDYEDFTDADKITEDYLEAVDVMVGIGVIEGISDTVFDAQGNFTREQAAKIIAYLKLGADAAKLSAASAPFTDVPANSWSAGYIAYCAEQGIIDGRGDGTFDPYARLTDVDFAKMLLCAVGYGVNGEYTGDLWYVKVQSDARTYGVFDDSLSTNFIDAATREECVLYAFNTLLMARVNYVELLNSYMQMLDPNNNIITLADNFDLDWDRVDGGDDYGRAIHKWQVKGEDITGNYVDDDPDYTAVVTENFAVDDDDDYRDFLKGVIGVVDSKLDDNFADDAVYYVNGEDGNLNVASYRNMALEIGDYIELYKNDNPDDDNYGLIDTIVIIRQDLVRVTSIVAVDSDEYNYDVSFEIWTDNDDTATEDVDEAVKDTDMAAAFATIDKADYARTMVEDYYFFATIAENGEIIDVTIPDVVNGSATAKDSANQTVTVNGTVYPANADRTTLSGDKTADVQINAEVIYNFYVSNGVIISYVTAEEGTTNYAFVLGIQANSSAGDLFGSSEQAGVAKAKIVTTEGKVEIVDLPVDTDDNDDYVFIYGADDAEVAFDAAVLGSTYDADEYSDNTMEWCEYTIDKDGNYKFVPVAADNTPADIYVDTDVAAIKATNADGNNLGFATANTVLTVVPFEYNATTGNVSAIKGVTTYTGYANFPAEEDYLEDDGANILLVYNKDNTAITNIYVFGEEEEATTTEIGLYLGVGTTDAEGTLYKFLVDGNVETYYMKAADAAGLDESAQMDLTFYEIEVDSDNYATVDPINDEAQAEQTVTGAVAGAYFTYDNGGKQVVYLADDCVVVDISNADTGKWAADNIAKEDHVVWFMDDDGEEAVAVFIISTGAAVDVD